jgi:hypothetical protein
MFFFSLLCVNPLLNFLFATWTDHIELLKKGQKGKRTERPERTKGQKGQKGQKDRKAERTKGQKGRKDKRTERQKVLERWWCGNSLFELVCRLVVGVRLGEYCCLGLTLVRCPFCPRWDVEKNAQHPKGVLALLWGAGVAQDMQSDSVGWARQTQSVNAGLRQPLVVPLLWTSCSQGCPPRRKSHQPLDPVRIALRQPLDSARSGTDKTKLRGQVSAAAPRQVPGSKGTASAASCRPSPLDQGYCHDCSVTVFALDMVQDEVWLVLEGGGEKRGGGGVRVVLAPTKSVHRLTAKGNAWRFLRWYTHPVTETEPTIAAMRSTDVAGPDDAPVAVVPQLRQNRQDGPPHRRHLCDSLHIFQKHPLWTRCRHKTGDVVKKNRFFAVKSSLMPHTTDVLAREPCF